MTKILSLFDSEYELAKAIKQGDRKAQTLLYDRYSGLMLAICQRYLGDKMLAEDVMIQGFMKIFDKIGQFSFNGSFEGWIKRIMVNEALMKLRSVKNIEVDMDEVSASNFKTNETTSLEREDLMKMIQSLPQGYRTVFNLYAIEGYSHAEIATQLGISEGTSKSQLSRARALLQEKLAGLDNELRQTLK
ncbi:RNA polymerase sigma factor [Jiulongibacter sediminis]|jgi:RNA polymerase sigma-70 factor (ECF subfamily)|uniref:RNA polymerase sigma-70 factor n=1 Tax=Jiulongibacter sediminis TaxID=1605367 RepID=A0A0P7BYH8_9BACT|nr:sigma-70 family RNA polymerase sigma factor [Jiulongibacter sediminis]KPM46613.1 RNA polymerase sigma-70 factor [Jiulongibacter sediminis]TBX21471.1 RNA polymerase sigma-70 factor [Jiulongibacter sediminis]